MNLRDLHYFEAVAELGHVHRAAKTLHLTQSAVTKGIRRLEAELGLQLLERAGRNVRVTDLGRVLQRHARKLQLAVEDARREMHDHGHGVAGEVRLGVSATAVDFLLPYVLAALVRETPAVFLKVVVGMNDDLCAQLAAGDLDLVLCPASTQDRALDALSIASDPVVVIARRAHPIFRNTARQLRDLCQFDWVLGSPSTATRMWLEQVFAGHGLPKPVVRIESGTTPRLVSGTDLLGFVARRNLRLPRGGPQLREVRLRATTMQRDFIVACRAGAYLSPAVGRVRDLALRIGRKVFATLEASDAERRVTRARKAAGS